MGAARQAVVHVGRGHDRQIGTGRRLDQRAVFVGMFGENEQVMHAAHSTTGAARAGTARRHGHARKLAKMHRERGYRCARPLPRRPCSDWRFRRRRGDHARRLGRRGRSTTPRSLTPPPAEWLTHGRDYAETHHSPLTQVDAVERGPSEARLVGGGRLAGQDRNDADRGERRALRHVDVERRVRRGRAHRRAQVALGSGARAGRLRRRRLALLLRPGQSRRGGLQGPRLRRACSTAGSWRSTPRRAACRGRCRPRPSAATTASPARLAS